MIAWWITKRLQLGSAHILSSLIVRAEKGEEIVIARQETGCAARADGCTRARPAPPDVRGSQGTAEMPDAFFFDPLPDDELDLWDDGDAHRKHRGSAWISHPRGEAAHLLVPRVSANREPDGRSARYPRAHLVGYRRPAHLEQVAPVPRPTRCECPVSAATAWEIATKVRIGKLDVPGRLLQISSKS